MSSIPSIPEGVCRHGNCVRRGKGRPPLCEEHARKAAESALRPNSFAPIPKSALMAGNARVARKRA